MALPGESEQAMVRAERALEDALILLAGMKNELAWTLDEHLCPDELYATRSVQHDLEILLKSLRRRRRNPDARGNYERVNELLDRSSALSQPYRDRDESGYGLDIIDDPV